MRDWLPAFVEDFYVLSEDEETIKHFLMLKEIHSKMVYRYTNKLQDWDRELDKIFKRYKRLAREGKDRINTKRKKAGFEGLEWNRIKLAVSVCAPTCDVCKEGKPSKEPPNG
jgi:hypothetical protein